MAHDGTGASWTTTIPTDSDLVQWGATEIRDLRTGVGLRVSKEHVAPASASVGGEHLQGSAKTFYTGTEPTKRPDATTNLDTADAGRLWYDSTNNQLLIFSGSAFVDVQVAEPAYAKLSHLTAATESAGIAFVAANTWYTRPLNTEDQDVSSITSLPGSNTFRLAIGRYRIRAVSAGYACENHITRLYRTTNTPAEVLLGTTARSLDPAPTTEATRGMSYSEIVGEFDVTNATDDFRIEHISSTTTGTNGMGFPHSITGVNNVYMVIELWKINR